MWRTLTSLVVVLCLISRAQAVAPTGLYGVDSGNGFLFRINSSNGAAVRVGSGASPSPMNGLAYDWVHDIMYGINPATESLYSIDTASGSATLIGEPGSLGFGNANGLAYDPTAQILYGTDNDTNSLFRINVTTGVGSVIAPITGGFTEIEGLAINPFTGALYGITDLQRRVVTIDPITGAATALSNELPPKVWRGLEFEPGMKALYAVAASPAPNFYRIAIDTGVVTSLGSVNGGAADTIQGLAFIPEPTTVGLLTPVCLLALCRRKRGTLDASR